MRHLTFSIFACLLCCISASRISAQVITKSSDSTKKKYAPIVLPKPKPPKPIAHELSGGFRLNTNGWSIFTDLGKVKSKDPRHSDMFHGIRLIQIELTEKKDSREHKQVSTNGGGTRNFIYGKINNLYALKLGWGFRKMLVGKPDEGSVSMHWANSGGFSLGLLKPYYINITGDPTAIKYDGDNKDLFLIKENIDGSAGLTKGIGEMKYIPGAHLKSAIHFDFSKNKKTVIGLEAGVNLEYYSQAVQLMVGQPKNSAFADLFMALQFGKRW